MSYHLFRLPCEEYSIEQLSHLRPGQLIKRRIDDIGIFGYRPFHHYGIIYQVKGKSLDKIYVAEFNIDTNKRICSLREFMYGITTFKIVDYFKGYSRIKQLNDEYSKLIYKTKEILHHCKHNFEGEIYDLKNNNCEDFVYSCIFKIKIPSAQLTHLRVNSSLMKYLTISESYLYLKFE